MIRTFSLVLFMFCAVAVSLAQTTLRKAPLDFNGDNKTDYVVARSATAGSQTTWFIHNQTAIDAKNGQQWGLGIGFTGTTADRATPGDYDFDNKTDFAVFRPGTGTGNGNFYILRSSNNTIQTERFGQAGDDPSIVGDYDGDGKTDVAVFRRGTPAAPQNFWYYRPSSTPGIDFRAQQWGQRNEAGGDFPVPGDFDGDGKYDFVVQRLDSTDPGFAQSTFFILRSSGGTDIIPFSQGSLYSLPGDYDGDGKTDLTGFNRAGSSLTFYIRNSSNGVVSQIIFGDSSFDFVVQGDYTGDGRTDIAVWRTGVTTGVPAVFYVLPSGGGGFTSFQWGITGDYPVAAFNIH